MSEPTPPGALRAPLQALLDRLQAPDAPASSVTLVVGCPGAGMSTALEQLAARLGSRVWMEKAIPVWSEVDGLRAAWFSDWPQTRRERGESKRDVLLLDQLQPGSALDETPNQRAREFQMDEVARWIARWTGRKSHHVVVGLSHRDHAELSLALERLPAPARGPAVRHRQVHGLGRLQWQHYVAPPDLPPKAPKALEALRALLDGAEEVWSGALVTRWLENHETRTGLHPAAPRLEALGLWKGLVLPPTTHSSPKGEDGETPLPELWMPVYAENVLRAMSRSQLELLLTCAFPESFPHAASRRSAGREQAKELSVLEDSGLLVRPANGRARIADPILARYLAARLPRPTRLHHISDVHFGGPQGWSAPAREESQAPPAAPREGEPDLFNSVKELLAWRAVEERPGADPACPAPARYLTAIREREPHVVLLSGDVLFQGNRIGGLDEAVTWLKALEDALAEAHGGSAAGHLQRLYAVGGNHDVQRPSPDSTDEALRHRLFRVQVLPLVNGEDDAADVRHNQLRARALPDLGIELILLESAIMGGEPNRVIHRLIDHLGEITRWVTPKSTLEERHFDAKRAQINNLARLTKKDMGSVDPGMVEPTLIGKLRDLKPHGELVRIAVLHHPISPIPGASTKEFPVVTNATALKHALFAAAVPIVVHGHEHRYHVATERWSGSTGTIRESETYGYERVFTPEMVQISAPTLASLDTAYGQGFVELEIQRELDWTGGLLSVDVTITHHLLTPAGDRPPYEPKHPTRIRVLDKHSGDSLRLLPRP